MSRPYFQLTSEERIALESEDFQCAIKLEAVERGIKLPYTVDETLAAIPYVGFRLPPDCAAFYEIVYNDSRYNSLKETGLAFKTEQEAERAINGAIALETERYGERLTKVVGSDFSVKKTYITLAKTSHISTALEHYSEDREDWDKLVQEIVNDFNSLRQAAYDKKIQQDKKKQYIELAKGDEEIAKAFWQKAERTTWPE